MNKLLLIMASLLVATPVFAVCDNAKVPADVAEKLSAVPLQGPTFDKNGFDIPDEYIENAQTKTKELLSESCFVLSSKGLAVSGKVIKDNLSSFSIEMSVGGKLMGTIEPNKPFGFNQANKFGSSYALLLRRLLGPVILRKEIQFMEHDHR